jgi:hypothetical protein
MDIKRQLNENKFSDHEDLPDGGRRYWLDVSGRHGWKARYVKIVDPEEIMLRFYQEIFNEKGLLVDVHEKYPVDSGHKRVEEA